MVPNVHAREDHIACASSTNSEIVVPVVAPAPDNSSPSDSSPGRLLAVLDVDSDDLDAFSTADQELLEQVCTLLGRKYGNVENL